LLTICGGPDDGDRSAALRPVNDTSQRERRGSQRERLVGGMIDVAGRDGYTATSIARVIARAGVSRPTFYEYFPDKEGCFLAALADVQRQILARVRQAVRDAPPERAMAATIQALVDFADAQPTLARLAMNEPMVCARRALDARDEVLAQIAQAIEDAHERVPANATIPDFSSRLLIGGIERQLAFLLRGGEPVTALLDDLLDWVQRYRAPAGEHRWRSLKPISRPPASPFQEEIQLRPAVAPARNRGHGRLSGEELAASNRRRILLAAAQLSSSKGYNATTLAEICELAEVDSRVLRRLFADKEAVFAAVHELHFQSIVAVTTRAFFSGESWPERIWEAGRAFAQSLEQNPSLAHVSFVEYYAAGDSGVQRNSELLLAFTVFLQEGYQYQPSPSPPSRVALAAIAATNFEAVYQRVRANAESDLPGLLPHAVFLELAPFLGPLETNRFIDERLHGGAGVTG
jgi:AcrR family transcriptional regulator